MHRTGTKETKYKFQTCHWIIFAGLDYFLATFVEGGRPKGA